MLISLISYSRSLSFVKFRKNDDYMGRSFLSLCDLNECVECKEMLLYSHSGNTQYGSITVDLSTKQVKINIPLEVRSNTWIVN